MRNKLRTILFGILLLSGSLFSMAATSPQAFAATYTSSVSTNLDQPPPYVQGYRQGYNDAVYDCQRNSHRFFARNANDYNRGYVDGYNYARAHDRACRPQPPNRYAQGYRQGYNDAVNDCQRNSHRFFARRADDYDRGYVDGYNYARSHDRACVRRH